MARPALEQQADRRAAPAVDQASAAALVQAQEDLEDRRQAHRRRLIHRRRPFFKPTWQQQHPTSTQEDR